MWETCADITVKALRESVCYEQTDLFESMYRGMQAKIRIMRQYPDFGPFVIQAFYEKDLLREAFLFLSLKTDQNYVMIKAELIERGENMPLKIVRNDITKMPVDAIVNAANCSLLGGGGVDGSIHRAAGKELLEECKTLGGCKTGEAKATGAYHLPCKYVIHTVGPVWRGGNCGEKRMLASCYRESLKLAKEKKCETVAFPLISAGAYGYPKDKALRVAADSIRAFLSENEMTVYLVIFDKSSFCISKQLFDEITGYINDKYCSDAQSNEIKRRSFFKTGHITENAVADTSDYALVEDTESETLSPASKERSGKKSDKSKPQGHGNAQQSLSLDAMLEDLDESFSQTLLRLIDEKGLTDSQCYKRANVDRRLFSKIRSDSNYRPSKQTAIAFAIALELSLAETEQLLRKAGYALSHSSKFDVIIEYFILKGEYDIFTINEVLFEFDQNLLGC